MRDATVRRAIVLELLTVTLVLAMASWAGSGCSSRSDPCLSLSPPPGCGDPPPPAPAVEEASPEDGTDGFTGAGGLDTLTGNVVFTVVAGAGTPPGQLCSATFQACVNLANGITGNEIIDLEVLPFDAGQPAPVIADLVYITANSLNFVNMTTRVAVNSGLVFRGAPTDLEIDPDGEFAYVAVENEVITVEIVTRRGVSTTTFPAGFRATSVAPASLDDEDDFVACGTDACYQVLDGVPTLLNGVRGGHVSFGNERLYIANPTQGIVVLDSATGGLVTTYPLPNATQCVVHAAGDCITCVAANGNETLVVEFDTLTDAEYRRITLPGTNRFIETSFTSRAFVIGQQGPANTGGVIHSCNADLECVARPQNLNRRAAFLPVNQPR